MIKIGDTCICTRGIEGIITKVISQKDGRKLYKGYRKNDTSCSWQSIKPRKEKQ